MVQASRQPAAMLQPGCTRTVFFSASAVSVFAPNLIFPCGVGVRHTGHPQRARCGEKGANQGRDEGRVSVNGMLV